MKGQLRLEKKYLFTKLLRTLSGFVLLGTE